MSKLFSTKKPYTPQPSRIEIIAPDHLFPYLRNQFGEAFTQTRRLVLNEVDFRTCIVQALGECNYDPQMASKWWARNRTFPIIFDEPLTDEGAVFMGMDYTEDIDHRDRRVAHLANLDLQQFFRDDYDVLLRVLVLGKEIVDARAVPRHELVRDQQTRDRELVEEPEVVDVEQTELEEEPVQIERTESNA